MSSDKTRISWTAEKYQKLFAACLAAHPEFKPNCNKVAKYFGEGATYDAIETRLRPMKQQAKLIRQAMDEGHPVSRLPPLQMTAKSRGATPAKRKIRGGEDDEEPPEKIVKKSSPSDYKNTTHRAQKMQKRASNDNDETRNQDSDDEHSTRFHSIPAYPTPSKTPTFSVLSKTSPSRQSSSSFPVNGQCHSMSFSTLPRDLAKPQDSNDFTNTSSPQHARPRYQTPEIIDLDSDNEDANMLVAITPSKKPRNEDLVKVKNEKEATRRRLAMLEAQDDDNFDYDP